jgi:hypothetical protein
MVSKEHRAAANARKRKQRELDRTVPGRPYEKKYRATDSEHEALADKLKRIREAGL